MSRAVRAIVVLVVLGTVVGCNDPDTPTEPEPVQPPVPVCNKAAQTRQDSHTPQTMVADWGQPIRLDSSVNNYCPQDAIEISGDGQWLYVMMTEDILDSMAPDRILARENNTYRLPQVGGPGEFGEPEYYDLAVGVDQSLDGEVSFAGDSLVYFHSLRAANTGNQSGSSEGDILDIYVADLFHGIPGPARNLSDINSIFKDGEHAIHPDGVTLYFASDRPGGSGDADLYSSTWNGSSWSAPQNLGTNVNSFSRDFQVTFTADGDTMYFASSRNPFIGVAIYRCTRSGGAWSPRS